MAAFASSYIPTAASQATRNADAASMTGVNFSGWYRQSEGSFVVSAIPNAVTATSDALSRLYWGVGDPANSFAAGTTMYLTRPASSININMTVLAGGVPQYTGSAIVGTQGAPFTHAFGYKVNDFVATLNGGAVSTDTLGLVPPVTGLALGSSQGLWTGAAATSNINGHIRKLAYYPARISNAALQAITS
jgi:hypothetical protein